MKALIFLLLFPFAVHANDFHAKLEGLRIGLAGLATGFTYDPQNGSDWFFRYAALADVADEAGKIIEQDLIPNVPDDSARLRLTGIAKDLREILVDLEDRFGEVDLDEINEQAIEDDFDKGREQIKNTLDAVAEMQKHYAPAERRAASLTFNTPEDSKNLVRDLVVTQGLRRILEFLSKVEIESDDEDDAHPQAKRFNETVRSLKDKFEALAKEAHGSEVTSTLRAMATRIDNFADREESDYLDDGITSSTSESTWTDLIERQQKRLGTLAERLAETGLILERSLQTKEFDIGSVAAAIAARPELFDEDVRLREQSHHERSVALDAEAERLRKSQTDLNVGREAHDRAVAARQEELERADAELRSIRERHDAAQSVINEADDRVSRANARVHQLETRARAVEARVSDLFELQTRAVQYLSGGQTSAAVSVEHAKLTAENNPHFADLTVSLEESIVAKLRRVRADNLNAWRKALEARGVRQDFNVRADVELHDLRNYRNWLGRWRGFKARGVLTLEVNAYGVERTFTVRLPTKLRYEAAVGKYWSKKFDRQLEKSLKKAVEITLADANPRVAEKKLSDYVTQTCAEIVANSK